jgi:hypothetical protein
MNAILGGTKGVSLTAVAEAVGVNVTRLNQGKNAWEAYLDGEPLHVLPHLQDRHGNAWPIEWVNFIQQMWLHETVTRKGEEGKDFCRDPKEKRGKSPLYNIHYLETPQYVAQEKIQSAAELRFNTSAYSDRPTLYSDGNYVYRTVSNLVYNTSRHIFISDLPCHVFELNLLYSRSGKARPCFPSRPTKNRQRHGGGIGKQVALLKPFQVKKKGRDQCLCHWHLGTSFHIPFLTTTFIKTISYNIF